VKITFDTNILISAAISTGVVHQLFESCIIRHTIISSRYIQDEFENDLLTDFKYSAGRVSELSEFMFRRVEFVIPLQISDISISDPDDLPILGTALAGKSDILLTGDKVLYSLGEYHGIRIIKPRDFPSELL
jgi:putative PIN family toxin of toxin-antitoxin system